MKTLKQCARAIHPIQRSSIFKDVMELYKNDSCVVLEYPLEIRFTGEKGVDQGGLSRDLFSGFWEQAYSVCFDGGSLITPCVRPDTDVSTLPVLGRIISHGYLATGFLPLRIAFPSLVSILLGSNITIPDRLLVEAFKDSVSCYEASILKEALLVKGASFNQDMVTKLISVISKFGCTEILALGSLSPKLQNVNSCVSHYQP